MTASHSSTLLTITDYVKQMTTTLPLALWVLTSWFYSLVLINKDIPCCRQ